MPTTLTTTDRPITHFKVKDKDTGIAHYGSGPLDEFFVRIQYSPKLGFQFPRAFKTPDEAEAFLAKVMEKGIINAECWTKVFYPATSGGRRWVNAQHVD